MPEALPVAELAPAGTLRVAVNTSNVVLVQPQADGALSGIVPVLGGELGRRLGVPVTLIPFKRPGEVFAAAAGGSWDVCFLAIEPARATEIAFTAPYVLIEGAYMVADGSPLTRPEQMDAPGLRVGVGAGSAYDLFLTRTLRHATIVRGGGVAESGELLKRGELDALAGVRQSLDRLALRLGAVHVVPERFMTIPQAAGVPRDRPASASAYLAAFVQDALRSGLVAQALGDSGQDPGLAAPPVD